MSDGGTNIYVVDPETLAKTSIINVKYGRRSQPMINELEWIDGKIWANIYLENKIIIIDPSTGFVEAYLDLRSLNDSQHGNNMADVLNGIAYDAATGRIFVTGKRWSKLFEIEVIK
jgi:glutamine cyclotransferase